jgi:probable O-glycosylation ligase (exosortase A-associated)
MLRAIFVLGLTLAGACLALKGPLQALLFYIWNAYFRPEEWVWGDTRDLILTLNASFWAGVLVVLSTLFGRTRLLWNGHIALVFLFAGHAALSAQLSVYSDYAWLFCGDFLRAVIITYLIAVLANDERKLHAVLLVMALSLGFEGAKQGWAELIRNPGERNDNTIAFLGDNNGVAVGMLMLVPILGAMAKTASHRWIRRLHLFLLGGVVYRALSTYSRGGFLAAGVLAIVYWVRSRRKAAVMGGTLLVAAVFLRVMPDAFWNRMHTITTYEETQDWSALSRLHFWRVAVTMAGDNPFLGVGFHSFNPAYDEYDSSFGQYGETRSVHSSWFGVLSELGYPGFTLYILIIGLAIRNCQVARRRCAGKLHRNNLAAYAVACETSLWVAVTGGSFLPFQYNEMLLHMIGLSIALRSVALRAEPSGGADERRAPASHAGRREEP